MHSQFVLIRTENQISSQNQISATSANILPALAFESLSCTRIQCHFQWFRAVADMSFAARIAQFVNSPTGPKTTHFWGPVANWGFVAAVSRVLQCNLKPQQQLRACMLSDSLFGCIMRRVAGGFPLVWPVGRASCWDRVVLYV